MNQRQSKQAAEDVLSGIRHNFKIVGKRRVHSWYAWAIIGIVFGMALGVVYVANNSGSFVASRAASLKFAVQGASDMAAGTAYLVGLRNSDNAFIASAQPYSTSAGKTITVGSQLGATFDNTKVAAARYNLDNGTTANLSAVFVSADGSKVWLGERSGQTITANTTQLPAIDGNQKVRLSFKGVFISRDGAKKEGSISGTLYAGIDVSGKYGMNGGTRKVEIDQKLVTPLGMPFYAVTPIKITLAGGKSFGDSDVLFAGQQLPGTWTLYYRDRDAKGTTDGDVEVFKKEFAVDPNHAPTFTGIKDQTVRAGKKLEYAIPAVDVDEDTITFTSADLPAGAKLDSSTGMLTWSPAATASAADSKTVTIRVSDPRAGTTSAALKITVIPNSAPVFNDLKDQTVVAGQKLTYTLPASDEDRDPLTFSASGLPTGATLDAKTGVLAWTPAETKQGYSKKLAVKVSDDLHSFSEKALAIAVDRTPNKTPVFNDVKNQTVIAGQKLIYAIQASDADGDPLTFSSSDLPEGAQLGAKTGVLTWTPPQSSSEYTKTTKISISDTYGGTSAVTIEITVKETPNHAPVFGTIKDQIVVGGKTLSYTIPASDEDGDAITFRSSELPDGAKLNPKTGLLTWTPAKTTAEYTKVAKVRISDPRGDFSAVVIEITVLPNRPPVFGSITNQEVVAGQSLTFTLTATDADKDPIVFSSTNLPTGATLNQKTGVFNWTPAKTKTSYSKSVTFKATDDQGDFAEKTITIAVSRTPNNNPVFGTIKDQIVVGGQKLTYAIPASDEDDDEITFTATGLPSGASLDATTGVLTWTPGKTTTEYTSSPTIRISDQYSGTNTATLKITVTVPPNNAPAFSPYTQGGQTDPPTVRADGQQSRFVVQATDPDGDGITFSGILLPSGATLTNHSAGSATAGTPFTRTAEVTWTIPWAKYGFKESITVRATDSRGLYTDKTYSVTALGFEEYYDADVYGYPVEDYGGSVSVSTYGSQSGRTRATSDILYTIKISLDSSSDLESITFGDSSLNGLDFEMKGGALYDGSSGANLTVSLVDMDNNQAISGSSASCIAGWGGHANDTCGTGPYGFGVTVNRGSSRTIGVKTDSTAFKNNASQSDSLTVSISKISFAGLSSHATTMRTSETPLSLSMSYQ